LLFSLELDESLTGGLNSTILIGELDVFLTDGDVLLREKFDDKFNQFANFVCRIASGETIEKHIFGEVLVEVWAFF